MMKTTVYGVRIATVLLVIYWLALFTGTHVPKVPMPHINNFDKVVHCSAFAVLAFLVAWAIPTRIDRAQWNVLIAAIVCVTYAAVDELSQMPVGRTADVYDWFADVLGTLLGLTTYLFSRAWLWRRQQYSPIRQPMPQ